MTTRRRVGPKIPYGPGEFEKALAIHGLKPVQVVRPKITYHAGPNEFDISYGPVRVEPIQVHEDMLLKAHAEFVRLRDFLKAHDFLDGPRDRKNPYIPEVHYSPPRCVPNRDPPDWLIEILVRRVAKTLRAEPSIKVRDMWGRLDRPVTFTRFRDGPESIWAKAHALNDKPLDKSNRGRKIGWRKKK
jgi:hypothetical protein